MFGMSINPISHLNIITQKEIRSTLTNVVVTVALACFISHSFFVGAVVGTAIGLLTITVVVLANREIKESQRDKKYNNYLFNHLFASCVTGPAVEEILYRGIYLSAIQFVASLIVPAVATPVALVASSIIFGRAHLSNGHSSVKQQAAGATIKGLVYGAVFLRWGLVASIGTHILNNTLALLPLYLIPENQLKDQQTV